MSHLRGARLSSRRRIRAARQFLPERSPISFARLAPSLRYWGNDQYGDCVSAEEFAAKSQDGYPGSDEDAITFARDNGGLNGSTLIDVLDYARDWGMTINKSLYKNGDPQSVDYTDWTTLCAAIAAGQVKIAVAADQLENTGAGEKTGWHLARANRDPNLDHCVGLVGYGNAAFCFATLDAPLPPEVTQTEPSVIMFTWATYGVVSYSALLAIMNSSPGDPRSEAWLRVPQTIAGPAPGPTPPPPPTPCACDEARIAAHFRRLITYAIRLYKVIKANL